MGSRLKCDQDSLEQFRLCLIAMPSEMLIRSRGHRTTWPPLKPLIMWFYYVILLLKDYILLCYTILSVLKYIFLNHSSYKVQFDLYIFCSGHNPSYNLENTNQYFNQTLLYPSKYKINKTVNIKRNWVWLANSIWNRRGWILS